MNDLEIEFPTQTFKLFGRTIPPNSFFHKRLHGIDFYFFIGVGNKTIDIHILFNISLSIPLPLTELPSQLDPHDHTVDIVPSMALDISSISSSHTMHIDNKN